MKLYFLHRKVAKAQSLLGVFVPLRLIISFVNMVKETKLIQKIHRNIS